MPGIFDDECRETGPIWPNPCRDAAHLAAGQRCSRLEVARTTAPFAPCQRPNGPRRRYNYDTQQTLERDRSKLESGSDRPCSEILMLIVTQEETQTMRDIPELMNGYRRFLSTRYAQEAAVYHSLAEGGQAPRTMVIACCDSRVDPAAIFNAGPGELFIVRNVANLVPPFEPQGDYHGTSAALEFAVTGLEVENIVVLGHARCGGVSAFLHNLNEPVTKPGFIDRWMSLLNPARIEAFRDATGKTPEELQMALEHAGVRHSLDNLLTFPFVKERHAKGQLRLRGGYFDIADGTLHELDAAGTRFTPIEP